MINVDAFLQSNNGDDITSSSKPQQSLSLTDLTPTSPPASAVAVQLTSWNDFVSSLRSPAQSDVESLLLNVTRNLDLFIGEASSNNLVTALIKESTKTIMTNRGGLKAASER